MVFDENKIRLLSSPGPLPPFLFDTVPEPTASSHN
jgi:hypothetical protein